MSVSKYEAAALYHYVSQQAKTEKKYLVFDLDDCSYGYCECSNENRTLLYHSYTTFNINLWDEFIKTVTELAGENDSYDISAEVQAQLASVNSNFQNYYLSEREINSEAFIFPNITITCEKLEKNLYSVRTKIEELVTQIKAKVSEENLIEVSIIVLGKAEKVSPIMFFLRELLSGDPILPDARFINDELQEDCSDFVRLGNEYLESLKSLKYSYILMGYDAAKNSIVPIWSVEKGQQEMDISKLQFSSPIMVSKGDKLHLKRDTANIDVPIPYSFAPMDSDLIEISIGVQDNTDTLYIRRCRFDARIYTVKLS